MRGQTVVFAFLLVILPLSVALAVGPTKTIEFPGGAAGKVVFNGKIHTDKGGMCIECHNKIWFMRRNVKITPTDHVAGRFCGACHNGKRAFDVASRDNCAKCHKK